jgi:co-chaperonin GroES (HSP10)
MTDFPTPQGYRILLELPKAAETISGSMILKSTATAKAESDSSVVARVKAMGADCYADPKRFPNGAWCKVGDWVLIRAYSGTRFLIDGEEYRLINDDTVEATVDGPGRITRI